MRIALITATILMLNIPQHISAQIYRLSVSGRVTSVSSSLSSRFSVGQSASATVIFDAASPGSQFYPNDPSIWYYPDAPSSGGLQVGGYTATFTSAARIFVSDNEGGTIDRFIFEDTDPIGDAAGGLPLNNFFINFQGGTNALVSTRLSDIPNRLSAFGPASAALDFGTMNNGANRVQISFDDTTLSAAPEPALWAMMTVGFGLAGAAVRRRKAENLLRSLAPSGHPQ